jgi:DNA-binding NtrC family response regulator
MSFERASQVDPLIEKRAACGSGRGHVLVVEDEAAIRDMIEEGLRDEGYEVTLVPDGESAVAVLRDTPVQVVLTDLMLPSMDGLEVLRRVQTESPETACIVMTGHGTVEQAVLAMKAGAMDFVTKPIQLSTVAVLIKKAMDVQRLRQENLLLKKTVRDKYRFDNLIGTSDAMREVLEFVEKVADSDSTVLIQGESGTGKELLARMLHFNSFRRDRPLVPVNCGAIPENLLESELFGHEKGAFTGAINVRIGRFEMAHGGTLFLDEVGELSPQLQVKLLRVLQERSFERVGGTKTIRTDVRIITATNQDLEQLVDDGKFRKDLFYRLHVIPITMPPLRDRETDIPLLVDHFLTLFNASKGTAIRGTEPAAMDYLLRYGWPGNIRELQNLVERVVILKKSGMITVADLPEKILQSRPVPAAVSDAAFEFTAGGVDLVEAIERYENRLIREALRQANGVTSRAAQLLRLNRTTLVEKLKRKGLDAKQAAS